MGLQRSPSDWRVPDCHVAANVLFSILSKYEATIRERAKVLVRLILLRYGTHATGTAKRNKSGGRRVEACTTQKSYASKRWQCGLVGSPSLLTERNVKIREGSTPKTHARHATTALRWRHKQTATNKGSRTRSHTRIALRFTAARRSSTTTSHSCTDTITRHHRTSSLHLR